MHELLIALEIIDAASEEARRHEGRVVAVHLKLGPLSGFAKEVLLSAYGLAREGTCLADAELRIEETPVTVHCPTCHVERAVVSMQQFFCAVCGTPAPDVVRGRELEIVALEIESGRSANACE